MSTDSLSLYALWAVVLVNLVLTVRLVQWSRLTTRAGLPEESWNPELVPGEAAPTFRARSLSGDRVTERTYAGRHVAYAFLSPNCDTCKYTVPKLQAFYAAARSTGTELVIVTDTGAKQTGSWLDDIRADGVEIRTPVIVAPAPESQMLPSYNGPTYFPYFAFVSPDGTVLARGVVGKETWLELTESWAGRAELPEEPIQRRDSPVSATAH